MNDQTYAMIFFENEGRVSQIFLNRNVMDFKDHDGIMYAFNDIDDGLVFYEELIRKINSDIDWMSVQP